MNGYLDFEPDDMEYVRSVIANAIAHGLTLQDVAKAAEHADTLEDFDRAVNLLCHMTGWMNK
jgi:hypothetical protein